MVIYSSASDNYLSVVAQRILLRGANITISADGSLSFIANRKLYGIFACDLELIFKNSLYQGSIFANIFINSPGKYKNGENLISTFDDLNLFFTTTNYPILTNKEWICTGFIGRHNATSIIESSIMPVNKLSYSQSDGIQIWTLDSSNGVFAPFPLNNGFTVIGKVYFTKLV